MGYGLGIDTGGTFTDAVIVDMADMSVVAKAKVPTTHNDLSLGLYGSVDKVFSSCDISPKDIDLIGVSTTLATNSVLEGKGGDVGLILIGWMPQDAKDFGAKDIAYVKGGYDNKGRTKAALDLAEVEEAIRKVSEGADAIAISGLFSVTNSSQERTVKEMAYKMTGLPTVAGFELSSSLGVDVRAETAVLNGRLIPLVRKFFDGLERTFREMGMDAPIMVYKGDGTLMTLDKARDCPVECVFSGPAASSMGGKAISGKDDFIMIDIGGTSTDVAIIRDGFPDVQEEGANINGWRTRVRAVDIFTTAMGGDSRISIPEARIEVSPGVTIAVPKISRFRAFNFTIGPERVLPLCRLADKYPDVCDRIRRSAVLDYYVFNDIPYEGLTDKENMVVDVLKKGPKGKLEIVNLLPGVWIIDHELVHLMSMGIVSMSSLTPIDLIVFSGELTIGNPEGPKAAMDALSDVLRMDKDIVLYRLLDIIHERIAQAILVKLMDDKLGDWRYGKAITILKEMASLKSSEGFTIMPRIDIPIVGIGAPTRYMMGDVSKRIGAEIIFPENGDVGNAVGAIGSKVSETYMSTITLMNNHIYMISIPYGGTREASTQDEALEVARSALKEMLSQFFSRQGIKDFDVRYRLITYPSPSDPTGETLDDTYFQLQARGIGDPVIKR